MSKIVEFKNFVNYGSNRLGNLIENPYVHFAGRKMGTGKKTMCVVEFTDLVGKTHRIKCSNRTQMKEAQLFLSIFKKEVATIKSIIAEYPISFGRIPKRFMKEFRNEVKHFGVTMKFANKLAGY